MPGAGERNQNSGRCFVGCDKKIGVNARLCFDQDDIPNFPNPDDFEKLR